MKTVKIDTKFEGKLTCGSKNDMSNLSNFHQSTWKSQNWDFDGILLSKNENDGRKIYSRVMYHDNEGWMQKLKRNWLVNSKLTWVIWWILTRVLKNLKHLHFNRLPLTKVYNIELKRYEGVMFHGTEYWCKIWRKTDLCFEKWHGESGKFWPEHSKVSKLGLWWNYFIQSRKRMTLKCTGVLCVMKEWCKIGREIGLLFQNWQEKFD